MEKLKFFYSSSVDAVGCDLNTIFSLLKKPKETGVSVEIIDTAKMEEKEVHEFYKSLMQPSLL